MTKHLREDEIVPYLDSRLSESERQRLDRHLADCSDCRTRMGEIRAVMSVLDEWRAVGPSPAFDAAVRERLRAEPEPARGWAWLRLRPAWAAALMLAVVAAIGLWQLTSPVPPLETETVQQQAQVDPTPTPESAPDSTAGEGDSLLLLDSPVLLENYELLAEFDVLFEPAPDSKKSKL